MPTPRRLDSLIVRNKDINAYKGNFPLQRLEINELSPLSEVKTNVVESTWTNNDIIQWLKPAPAPTPLPPTLKLLSFRTRNARSANHNRTIQYASSPSPDTMSDEARASQVKFIIDLFDTLELPLAAIGSYIKSHTTFAIVPGSHRDQISRYYCSGTSWTVAWAYSHATKCTSAVMFHREGDGDDRKADVLLELQELRHPLRHPLLLGYIKTKISLTFTFSMLDSMNRETLALETTVGLPVWDWNLDQEEPERDVPDDYRYCIGRANVLSGKLINVKFRLRTYQKQIEFILRHNQAFRQSASNSGQTQLDCAELEEILQGISDLTDIHLYDAETLAERLENQRTSIYQLNNLRDTEASLLVAADSHLVAVDSHKMNTSMYILATISLIFLPGTFVASIFDIPMFQWSTTSTHGVLLVPFILFWCISGGLTISIMICCFFFDRHVRCKYKQDVTERPCQNGFEDRFDPKGGVTSLRRRVTGSNSIEMRRFDTTRSSIRSHRRPRLFPR